jgi:hypothetical protein
MVSGYSLDCGSMFMILLKCHPVNMICRKRDLVGYLTSFSLSSESIEREKVCSIQSPGRIVVVIS